MNQEKSFEYSQKIIMKFQELFDEGSEVTIDPTELTDDQNMKDLMHALFNIAPSIIYSTITADSDKNMLECNHIANQLCFEYMQPTK